jgi:DNA invertase Pin-like site-specific DNA recombinase
MNADSKVQARHLSRSAYLYVRQSTLRQVFENTESTQRQYDLRQRALAHGWKPEQVVVIDCDLGLSGASAVDRAGFQRLVAEVSLGRAGVVMGLEVSRLARNSTDWHRLLEICALSETLVLDDEDIYDPAHFNDRLLLGLKGTMSEAELHILRSRLRGGLLNKARRGALKIRLPMGLVYDNQGHVRLDPDAGVRESVRQIFRTFQRTGSASATVKELRGQGLKFPRRLYKGARTGEVVWQEVEHSRVLWVLKNPRYAGAFCFGRSRTRKYPDGHTVHERLAPEQWLALVRDAHESYISWEDYEHNVQRLRENAHALGVDRERGAPREGPALLQGLALCAVCGDRMTVRYHATIQGRVPDYVCQRRGIQSGQPVCQQINGGMLDDAIGKLLVDKITPVTLEVALRVQQELDSRSAESQRLHQLEVERARYQSDLARRRYMQVDPEHRMVADSLEAEWNLALRAVSHAQDRYEKQRQADTAALSEQQRASIMGLAKDFSRLWNDPRTPARERKRLARLLICDVTLLKGSDVGAQVRFNGGATHTLHIALPKPSWMVRQTPQAVVAEIDRLLDDHTDGKIAAQLNAQGTLSGQGRRFNGDMVARIRRSYNLRDRYARLRERGLLSQEEIAKRLGIIVDTLKIWRRAGLLKAHRYNDKGECLYELPGADAPKKKLHQGKSAGRSAASKSNDRPTHS